MGNLLQVPDGVTAATIGNIETYPNPVLIIGGNCSIQGFDWRGQEVFWTVTGDNVRSMLLVDIDLDGANEVGHFRCLYFQLSEMKIHSKLSSS